MANSHFQNVISRRKSLTNAVRPYGSGSRNPSVASHALNSPLSPLSPNPEPIARDLGAGIKKGDVKPDQAQALHPGDVKLNALREWDNKLAASLRFSLAQTVLSRMSMQNVLVSRQTEIADINRSFPEYQES